MYINKREISIYLLFRYHAEMKVLQVGLPDL